MKKMYKGAIIAATLIMMNNNVVYAESFNNLSEVQSNIYEHLKNRDAQISFSYSGDTNEFKNELTNIIKAALKEDDYTERSWIEIKPKADISKNKAEATINITYLTTKAEETYVESEIQKIVSQIIIPGMSDTDKIRAISDYLIGKLDYDYTFKSNNSYTALTTGKCTCQGYSMTTYKLLTEAGFTNRIIIGKFNNEPHSWNYVKIGDTWYHLDITNNDSTRSDKYFLVGDDMMIQNNYYWNKVNYPQK
ncbi:transglutaminase domain-containing protein [Clostridium butyricum]|uniref:transglutaminase domain-containing protein n=1 Tax=Clostridium butyricum TaxID=1492 RepID=UPI0022E3569D|nr:transglutaminase-like domain-containing protein [Clostridium butyricum]MDU3597552.1 transglutaminase-like domain-containing protein [Clostridium butyricum]